MLEQTTDCGASASDYDFSIAGADATHLRVTAFKGVEGISELYRFRIALASGDGDWPRDAVLGQPARLRIRGAGTERFVHGIVRRFSRTGEGVRQSRYAAELVPLHWLLTQRRGCRIFQEHNCPDMTVPGIVRKVLADAGLPAGALRFALAHDAAPREYVVQYRESEMDFISRLMEQEGLFYFFEHTADGHCMVVADSAAAHPRAADPEIVFRSRSGLVPERDRRVAYRIRDLREIQPGAVELDDFNFTQPQVNLRVVESADGFTALTRSDYPGEYQQESTGRDYARIRLEQQQRDRERIEMLTAARGLEPGRTFELREHPCAPLNRAYLATRVVHTARQPQSGEEEAGPAPDRGYRATVQAIPATVTFRPAQRTRVPTVRGSQTAIVVGPQNEEIYTDKYGRVKVQFHWDHEGRYDEHSSCWIRVSHGAAGGQYGMLFLPRVGQEVVVDFLEGNPDRPLVTGRVYNHDQMPPYALPAEKTRSVIKTRSSLEGGGTNEIRFEDRKGHEQLLLFAQRDLHLRCEQDHVETAGRDRHVKVTRNLIERVDESRHCDVALDVRERVGGTRSLEVHGDMTETIRGNRAVQIDADAYLNAGGQVVLESASSLTLKVAGNFIRIDASGVHVVGTQVKLNCAGQTAGVGRAILLLEPAGPLIADAAAPGYDVRYQQDRRQQETLDVASSDGAGEGEDSEVLRSWIEIELVDEIGQPVPHEAYEIVAPDGETVKSGTLDAQGQARVAVRQPGTCRIRFPRLDAAAWRRAGG